VAAASPLILSGTRPGLVWYGGGRISLLGNALHEGMWHRAADVSPSTRNVGFVTACAMLVRCAAFEAVKGFDPALITYSDDLDFSIRLQKQGFSLSFVPAAVVTHGESVNVIKVAGKEFRDYYTMRNRLAIIWKYGTHFQKSVGIVISMFWHGCVFGGVFLACGEWRRTRALAKGIRDFFYGRSGFGEL
jgi:GT2 family glycosyltransferase